MLVIKYIFPINIHGFIPTSRQTMNASRVKLGLCLKNHEDSVLALPTFCH